MRNSFGPGNSTDSQFVQSVSGSNGSSRPGKDTGKLVPQDHVVDETGAQSSSRGRDVRPRRALHQQRWTPAPHPPTQQPSVAEPSMMPITCNQLLANGTMHYQPTQSTYHYPNHPLSTFPYNYQYPNVFDHDPDLLPMRPNPKASPQEFNQSQMLGYQNAYNPAFMTLPPIQTSMSPPGPIVYPVMADFDMPGTVLRPPQRQQCSHTYGQMPYEYPQAACIQPEFSMSSRRPMVSSQGIELPRQRRDTSRDLISGPRKTDVRKRVRETDSKLNDLKTSVKRHKSGVSDEPIKMQWPTSFETKTIGRDGLQSGRNLLAKFEDLGDEPRTRYNLRVLGGRGVGYLSDVQGYPECDKPIPGGITLEEICQRYPRHVWGTGIRMFIANGWDGEKVYHTLPTEFRISKAVQRPWNFMQQGFSREIDRMKREDAIAMGQETETDKESTLLDEAELTHWDDDMPQDVMYGSVDRGHTVSLPPPPQWSHPASEQHQMDEHIEIDGVAGTNDQTWVEKELETGYHDDPGKHQSDRLNDQVEQNDHSVLDEPRYQDLFMIVHLIYAIYEACGVRERHIRFQKALVLLILMRANPENVVEPRVDLAGRLEDYYDRICQQNGFEVKNMSQENLFALSQELVRRTMICLNDYNAHKSSDEVEEKPHESDSTGIVEETGEPEIMMSSDFELFDDFGEPEPLDQ